jgi:hypothetical protein
LWGVIGTDQAVHFSILAVSFYGWRVEGTSPAWRATEGGPITVLRRRCGSDDGRPARGSGAQGTVALAAGVRIRETRGMRSRPASSCPTSTVLGLRRVSLPARGHHLAVRRYLRFGLSFRTSRLAERGIEVDHVSIYRWVQRFAPEFAEAARARQHVIGDRWHVNETYLKVGGVWRYLFRA